MAVSQAVLNKRAAFIANAYKGIRNIGTQNVTLGTTSRFKLDPVGAVYKVVVEVTANVTISGSALNLSLQAPFNMVTRVQLQDGAGTIRINAPAMHVWMVSSVWNGKPDYRQSGVMFNSPILPTQIGANQTIKFLLAIPISYSEFDLRGILPADNNQDQYLSLDFASTLLAAPSGQNDNDIFYTGPTTGSVTVNSASVTCWQYYYAGNSAYPIPSDDVATIHYIEGFLRVTDGLIAGSERFVNYPVSRSTVLVTMLYQNGGQMLATDVSKLRQLAAATEILTLDSESLYGIQRDILGGTDFPYNCLFIRSTREVVTRAANANQIGFTPAAASAGNTYLGVCFESFGV